MLKGNFMTVMLSDPLFTRQDHPESYLIVRRITTSKKLRGRFRAVHSTPLWKNIEKLSSQTKRHR
jgi:hypothetical protein